MIRNGKRPNGSFAHPPRLLDDPRFVSWIRTVAACSGAPSAVSDLAGLAPVSPLSPRLRKLIARLHAHPVLGGAPADAFQRQSHVGRYVRLAIQKAPQGPGSGTQERAHEKTGEEPLWGRVGTRTKIPVSHFPVTVSRSSRYAFLQRLHDPSVQAQAALRCRERNALMQVWPKPNVKLA